eukprot:CAMPEP_0196658162 /NCGR_PEP_ID=MMETSP1086-20130531/27720_1 /TAXON_ID=77921 /ORGANISM="Cyanoptyche  gloeocystis , Strain SAG4.97" /LENGTH=83 /DNA_ID=CAMNT_0041991607 /DNA_START=258 /DNA_END=509 /DNA_ORIENTATION=+
MDIQTVKTMSGGASEIKRAGEGESVGDIKGTNMSDTNRIIFDMLISYLSEIIAKLADGGAGLRGLNFAIVVADDQALSGLRNT